jgi:hypothetical protein
MLILALVVSRYCCKSGQPVSKEIISFFRDKYRLPMIHSSLISISIEPASLSNEVSFGNAPIFLLLRLSSL